MQDCCNSIANALGLLQSCTKPSKILKLLVKSFSIHLINQDEPPNLVNKKSMRISKCPVLDLLSFDQSDLYTLSSTFLYNLWRLPSCSSGWIKKQGCVRTFAVRHQRRNVPGERPNKYRVRVTHGSRTWMIAVAKARIILGKGSSKKKNDSNV